MAQGFAVTISAVDQVTGPLSNIGQELGKLGRQMREFQKQSGGNAEEVRRSFFARSAEFTTHGSRELGKSFREIGKQAREVGEHLSKAFEPLTAVAPGGGVLGALLGAGGLAGIADGIGRLAEKAEGLKRLSERTGFATTELTHLGNAARLAGADAESLQSGIENLRLRMTNAAFGRDGPMLGFLRQAGIDMGQLFDENGKVKKGVDILGVFADALLTIKDPAERARVAVELFGNAAILPLMDKGSKGIRALAEEARRLTGDIDGAQTSLERFGEESRKTGVAIGGLSRHVGGMLSDSMEPLVKKTNEWLAQLNNSPEALKLVTAGVEVLATAIGVTLVAALTKATVSLTAWWALPAVKFLTGPIGLSLLGLEFGTSHGVGGLIPRQSTPESPSPESQIPLDDPAELARRREQQGGFWGGVGRFFGFGGGKPAAEAPIPPMRPGANIGSGIRGGARQGGYTLGQMKTLAMNAGFVGADADRMAALAMVESSGNPNAEGAAGELGLTQVNPNAWGQKLAEEARDPQRAFQIAKMIHGKQGWGAWKTSVAGAEQYLANGPIKAEPLAGEQTGGVLSRLGNALGIGSAQAAPMPGFGGRVITDISKQSGIQGSGPMQNVAGMIVHHTAGRGSVDNVLDVFRQRGVASNFVIDRSGQIFQVLPTGTAGRHIMRGWGPVGEGKSNQNMEGVEIIAKDDRDVTAEQKAAGVELIRQRSALFGYDPKASVFGHGEVNPGHRQESEGMSVVDMIRGGALDKVEKPAAEAPIPPPAPAGWRGFLGDMAPGDLDFLKGSGNNDSKHSVDININGAPQGTRASIKGDGPAQAKLRTQFAFGAA